jgi:magnesium chelatase family protein
MREQVARQRGRLSGPLLDRIDLHVTVGVPREAELLGAPADEPSAQVAARENGGNRQIARQSLPNALLQGVALDTHAPL